MSMIDELLQQGRAAISKGDLSQASTYIDKTLQVAPPGSLGQQQAHVLQAKLVLRSGDTTGAETLALQALERYGPTPRVLATLGQVREVQGQWKQAATAYEEAASEATGTMLVALLQNAAWAWLMTGDPARASVYLASAAPQLTAEFTPTQQALSAYSAYLTGNLEHARAIANKVQPGSAWATCVAAITEASVCLKQGHLTAARQAVMQAESVVEQATLDTGTDQLLSLIVELRRVIAA